MKLYVCWAVNGASRGHPCGRAYDALRAAGHDPEVIRSRGSRLLPDVLNRSEGRREARRLTGGRTLPVLVTDDGDVVADSKRIIAWAQEHPAGGRPSTTAAPR